MEKVVITGGVGYVGRALTARLGAVEGIEVHVVDTLECGEHRLAQMNRDEFTLHRVDIRDSVEITRLMEEIKPEKIIHLAAIHYIPECEQNPARAADVNVTGTVNLLAASPPGCKFVFASSAAVYAPEDNAHTEQSSQVLPMDIYGWTKHNGEKYVEYFHQQKKIQGVIVRLFNVVGSGETNPHLAPAIIEQLNDDITTIKLGNLFPQRDYINVVDVADGFARLSNIESNDNEAVICNLGTGVSFSVGEMVQFVADAAEKTIAIEQDENRIRSVDRPMLKASVDNLVKLTDWCPKIPLSQSMMEAWNSRQVDKLGS